MLHKRSYGGASSPQLLAEAVALHKRLGDVVLVNLFGDRARRAKAQRAMRRAYLRACRRDVRLEIQRGEA